MFQLKDFQSIVASMVNYARGATDQLTDFARGSVTRTMLEAPAVEIDQLYQEMFAGVREGIETSVFRSFGLPIYDGEEFSDRQSRFNSYVLSLARATPKAIEAGAMTASLTDVDGLVTERVKLASTYEPFVDDPAEPVGFVQCFIHNGVSATTAELVAEAQKIIDGYVSDGVPVYGWKGAGLPCSVSAAADVSVDATFEVEVTSGDPVTVTAAAEQAVRDFILAMSIGEDFSPYCGATAARVSGVGCATATTAAVPVAPGEKAVPGIITVTAV